MKNIFPYKELYRAVLSLAQWVSGLELIEEKDRRQMGILNSASFSLKDFALHLQTTLLG